MRKCHLHIVDTIRNQVNICTNVRISNGGQCSEDYQDEWCDHLLGGGDALYIENRKFHREGEKKNPFRVLRPVPAAEHSPAASLLSNSNIGIIWSLLLLWVFSLGFCNMHFHKK